MKYRRILIFSTSETAYGAERGLLLFIKWGLRKKLFENAWVVLPKAGPLQEMLSGNPSVTVVVSPLPFVFSSDLRVFLRALLYLPVSFLYWALFIIQQRIGAVVSNTSLTGLSLPLALFFPHFFFMRECFPDKKYFTGYQRMLGRVSKRVFAVSAFVKHNTLCTKSSVLHEPIDSSGYGLFSREDARKMWDLPREARVVLLAGRLHPEKGCDRFLDEIENLGQFSPAREVYFLIAGDVPGQNRRLLVYKTEILSRIRKLERLYKIRFLGYVADMGVLYAASDVCVFPYQREEFYGFSILEALFFRKRILVSCWGGGIPEYLEALPEEARFTSRNLRQAINSDQTAQIPRVRFPKLSSYLKTLEEAFQ
jgi:glycosyltransferase involved in cell wall biosynthesis